ncbi:hypothetical protein M569_06997, partial [Genlisea aurea]
FSVLVSISWVIGLWMWRNRRRMTWNWPIVGMMPKLAMNAGRVHEICTEVLAGSRRETFWFKGPWFSGMEILGTSNAANVHYVMSANFGNFPKGAKFKEMFDVFGDGIFNSDSDSWQRQRKTARALINHRGFQGFVSEITRRKIETGLIPVMEMACRKTTPIDLQEIFQRLTFDTTCAVITGYDPLCLSPELPEVPFSAAMDAAEDSIFMRHILPETIWKLQRWIGIGSEKRLKQAKQILDTVIAEYITRKREELLTGNSGGSDLLTSYILDSENNDPDDKFLRDTILNLMIAGRDTTSSALTWLLWLVSTHSHVQNRIRAELKSALPEKTSPPWIFTEEETRNTVYLHAAVCESLRLYPPVPFQHKEPAEDDTLPSGHRVSRRTKVVLFLYAMGRMESIWGKDCGEFKPERWISERGTIRHQPSYKFLAFNAGPRTCLGREAALSQIKMVAAAIIQNYEVGLAEGHVAAPNCSVILYMKNGLKVWIRRRI